jgi:hypothetical protein
MIEERGTIKSGINRIEYESKQAHSEVSTLILSSN